MRNSRYRRKVALACQRTLCWRCTALWFTETRTGRVILVTWAILVAVGLVALLSGCEPRKSEPQPKPQVSCTESEDNGLKICYIHEVTTK